MTTTTIKRTICIYSSLGLRPHHTNHCPLTIFFQNLRCPSMDAVMTKCVAGSTTTCDSTSRCMNDRSYIAALGSIDSASRVAATESGSRDAMVFFFFLAGGASGSEIGVGVEVEVGSTDSEAAAAGGGGGGPTSESESESTCGEMHR